MKASSGMATAVSNMPTFMSKRAAGEDGSYYLKMGDKYNDTDFSTTWALSDKLGWYLQRTEDGKIELNGDAQPIQGPEEIWQPVSQHLKVQKIRPHILSKKKR